MPNWDLQSGVGRLQRETKHLADRWQETKQDWDDQASRQFEEKYLAPLLPQVKLTLAAVHQLIEVMGEAEKECGSESA